MLRSQKSFLLNRTSCRRHLGHVNGLLLREQHLCTEPLVNEGICMGDIGNPLITSNKEIVGIASWKRSSDCGNGYPNVYTRVFFHLPWIYRVLSETGC